MEWVKRQSDGDGAAYAKLREFPDFFNLNVPPILPGWAASRFDCSKAYYPALEAVKAGNMLLATEIIAAAGVFESREQPPDWCYE